jgi:hypothetical protein
MAVDRTWLADSSRWNGFAFRAGDIVISTPAKCGTTWMQMICALLVFGDGGLPGPLTEISPWLDIRTVGASEVFAALEGQRHRRFIKTHTPLDGLPFDERVTYICVGRDPRDAAISAGHHLNAMNRTALLRACAAASPAPPPSPAPAPAPAPAPGSGGVAQVEGPADRFRRWVEADRPPAEGLELLLHHLGTFWERRSAANVILIHYDDLQADLEGEMRRLAGRLGITVAPDSWPALAAEAGFDRMRARAAQLAPQVTTPGLWTDAGRFFNRGTSGQWRSILTPAELARYRARIGRLAPPPDLTAWAHTVADTALTPGAGHDESRRHHHG